MAPTPEAQSISLWLATAPRTDYPRLDGTVNVDVAVLGGGIAGLTAALALKHRGLSVAVVEAARIGTGVTGNTTGKVTSLHRLAYTELASTHDIETARDYGRANQAAIEHIARTIEAEGLDCGFRRVANYTYAESSETLAKVRDEAELAASLGLPASFTADVPLPFSTLGAVRFDDQAQFHAVRYLQGLARAVDGGGSSVFEGSPVRGVRSAQDGSPAEVTADGGRILARDVIVATNVPLASDAWFGQRCYLHRSYIVAAPMRGAPADATFISADEPMRSILSVRLDGTDYVLVGGEGHRVAGEGGSAERFGRLASFARERLGTGEPAFQWSTQDVMPADGLPFAGRSRPDSEHVYLITGLRKWGLTNGTAGALAVADLVSGVPTPWAQLFDTRRAVGTEAAPPSSSALAEATPEATPERVPPATLAPGQGTVVDVGGEPTAVYSGAGGSLRALTAVCTHLGCTVEFNASARTWDCPCHGSRFSLDGSVIQGPAERNLAARAVPEELPPPQR